MPGRGDGREVTVFRIFALARTYIARRIAACSDTVILDQTRSESKQRWLL